MILQSPNQSSPLRLGSDLPIPPLHSLSPSNTALLVDPHTGQKLSCRSTSEYSCILLTEHSSPDICMLLPHLVQACALLNSQGSFPDPAFSNSTQPPLSLSYFSALFSSTVLLVNKRPTIC